MCLLSAFQCNERRVRITFFIEFIIQVNGLDLGYATRYPTVFDGTLTGYEMTALRQNTTYRLMVMARTRAGTGLESFLDVTTKDATSGMSSRTEYVMQTFKKL